MRRTLAVVLMVLVAVSGCAKKKPVEKGKVEIEVAAFQGGFGLDFFEYAAREYEKLHPNVKIKLWGNPRVWEQLRPRFVSGDVPDLCWPGWGLDIWALVAEGQVMEMDKYLQTKAYGQDKPWKDTFLRGSLEKGSYDGHCYILPFTTDVYGWWYNVEVFREHGWTPPKTYEELLVLCEKIKRTGIAPITYQGKYPTYMLRGFLIPWAISAGGFQAYKDALNLKPGAWNSPAFLRAAEMVAEIRDKGYFQKGALGMDHTSSQMEFVIGRAAMITCGTWLGAEMKDQMPAGFRLEFFKTPVLSSGKGDPSIVCSGVEQWIIPKGAKHPDESADFYKFIMSLDMAKKFVVEKKNLMSTVGSDDVQLPADLVTAAKCLRNAKETWDTDILYWYPAMNSKVESAMAGLLSAELSPKQCVDAMERAAEETRKDSSILRHKVD